MYGTAEYVKLKYVSEPFETLIRDKTTPVRILVFTSEYPIKQVFPVWKVGDVLPMPEIGVEYHINFTISSFARRDKKTGYKKKRGRYGETFETSVEYELTSYLTITRTPPHLIPTRKHQTVDEFLKNVHSKRAEFLEKQRQQRKTRR